MTNYNDITVYYNTVYYKELGFKRPEKHFDIYLKYLNLKGQNKKILDIGCGLGAFIGRAIKNGYLTFGIDISDKAIAYAKGLYSHGDFRVGRAEELPWPDAYFDGIVCLGSLEHFLNVASAIREMVRVSHEGTKVIIMVPNVNFPGFHGTEQTAIKEDLFDLEEWSSILCQNGLTVPEVHADRWPVRWISLPKRDPLKFILRLCERCKVLSLPIEKCYQFIFVCRKC